MNLETENPISAETVCGALMSLSNLDIITGLVRKQKKRIAEALDEDDGDHEGNNIIVLLNLIYYQY